MWIDVEGEADWILQQAGFDGSDPVPMRKIAEAHLGPGCVRIRRTPLGPANTWDHRQIWIHPRLSRAFRRFVIAHELAELRLRELDYRESDVERVADALAGALVAPRRAYQRRLREHGEDLPRLAKAFCASQTCIALRHAEVTGAAVAVLSRTRAYVRDGDSFRWPHEERLRAMLSSLPPRVRRVDLTDSRKRLALIA